MSDDQGERIIDSLLAELLGGQAPPDLTQRILAAHGKQAKGGDGSDVGEERGKNNGPLTHDRSTLPAPVPAPPRETITSAPKVTPVPRTVMARRRPSWRVPAIVAAVLISASVVGVWALRNPEKSVSDVPPQEIAEDASATKEELRPPGPSALDEPVDDDAGAALLAEIDHLPVAEDPTLASDEPAGDTVPEPSPGSSQRLLASSDQEIIEFVDGRLAGGWDAAGLEETPTVSDAVWCRRVYRKLLGRPPKTNEVYRFVNDRDRRKRSQLVRTLLEHEDTASEFAHHWAGVLATMLIGDQPRSNVDRAELERYLRASLFNDKPYDQVAFELLTAVGSNKPGREDFNGATNFLLAFQDRQKKAATDQVCRVFLGRRMQCAQCHDHPMNEWRQEQYWQLASFFMQMQSSTLDDKLRQLVNRDYRGESGTPQEAEVFYVEPGELNRVAYPVYLDGREARSRSGLIADIDRRQELAGMLVKSDEMSRAFVNRVWDQVFGSGFTHPVDDMGFHNPPSHPRLLDRLASEFQAHNYGIQKLLRWVVLSKAFDRPPVQEFFASSQFHTFHEPPTPQPLGRLLQSLADARRSGRQFDPIAQFHNNGENGSQDRSVTARLNGTLRFPILSTAPDGLLYRISNSKLTEDEMIRHLFLATVSRDPKPHEWTHARSILRAGSRLSALQEIGATLLISREFVDEH